jgi:lipopolysaccharide transport system ATP-binding protein
MQQIAIRINQLSKRYMIGQLKTYKTLRDSFSNIIRSPFSFLRTRPAKEFIWALKDINLEICRGEFVGVIGRNGAGKSTLLKILARITEPTEGYAEIHGRVSSLLEVGTGFHPELTGRENIYLNGSILGMKRDEIHETFDQIVDFSGVSKFIDTQVKHYSSGMKVRLAFSVAAHLKPEILFVDEVLSVGDLDFQQKCLAKMKEVTSTGRTVILVSHNLAAIKEMSHRCVLLKNGKLEYVGNVDETLARYSSSILQEDQGEHSGNGWSNVSIEGKENSSPAPKNDQQLVAKAFLDLSQDIPTGSIYFVVKDSADNFVLHERLILSQMGGLRAGRHQIKVELPVLWLAAGVYVSRFRLHTHLPDGDSKVFFSPQIIFTVTGPFRGRDHSRVLLHPNIQWEIDPQPLVRSDLQLIDQ